MSHWTPDLKLRRLLERDVFKRMRFTEIDSDMIGCVLGTCVGWNTQMLIESLVLLIRGIGIDVAEGALSERCAGTAHEIQLE